MTQQLKDRKLTWKSVLSSGAAFAMYLTMRSLSLWNCFVAGMWQNLELWVRKVTECWKQNFTGHSYGTLEDKNAEGNMGSGGSAHEVSEGIKDSTRHGNRNHSGDAWPRMSHHFASVLRTWVKVNLHFMNKFVGQRKFPDERSSKPFL